MKRSMPSRGGTRLARFRTQLIQRAVGYQERSTRSDASLVKHRHFTNYFAPDARFPVVGEIACFRQLTNCFGPGRPCELRGTRSRFNRTVVLRNCNGNY